MASRSAARCLRQRNLVKINELVLDAGRVVEQGTFSELLYRHGPFASLYRTQFALHEDERNFRLVK